MTQKTLLLVEDEDAHFELIKRSIESGSNLFEIINVKTLEEAKNFINHTNIDLILCDWRLPDGDGIDLLKFTGLAKKIPLIMMTSYGNEKFAVEAIKLGALDYVVKSVDSLNNMDYILNKSLREWELININEKMQSELRKSEELLSKIFNNAIDIIFIKNSDKEFISVNNAFLNMFNLDLEDVIGENFSSLKINVDLNLVEQTDNLVLNGETVNQIIKFNTDNNVIVINEIKSPLYDDKGEIIGILSIGRDVTETEMQKEQLRRLSIAVEQNPTGILIMNKSGTIIYANKRFCEITGYSVEEIAGKVPFKPYKYDYQLANWKDLKPGDILSGEIYDKKKDGGHYWGFVAISSITDDNKNINGYVAILEDTTQKKEFERQLITAKEEAVKADRLKSEFLAQMSHEIRTPINTILSFSGLLKLELQDRVDNDFSVIFDMMEISGRRIIRTIDLLLNMSELQTGSFKRFPTNFDIEKRVLEFIYNENINEVKRKGIELRIDNRLSDNEIYGDEYSIHQICSILVENAVKFTEKGGVQVVVFRDQQKNLVFEVRDSGIGISEEYLPNLFTPFSQEEQGYSRKFEGNGLGLAIAKRYCDLNNAKITVKSKKGVGSTFTVEFTNH
jgi:PAS domain S-box-containing protein